MTRFLNHKIVALPAALLLMCGLASAQFNDNVPVIPGITPTGDRPRYFNDGMSDVPGLPAAQQVAGDAGTGQTTHPLGLLPNPVLRTDTRYTYEDLIWRDIDTTLIGFHEYNPVWKWRYPHLYLGNVGQAYRSLVFDPEITTGLRPGFDAYRKYWYTPGDVKFYNTKIPFTSLYYNTGKSVENNAHIVHSQNIGPFYNAAFDYRLLNSVGAFTNQKTLIHSLNVNNWYNSRNHRYTLAFAFLFNRMRNQENGGVDFEGLFDKANSGVDRALVPVNLGDAQNEATNRGLYLKQYFFLGPVSTVKTSDTTELDVVQRKSAISYAFHFDNFKCRYTDSERDTGYYRGFYYDSTMTGDSTMFWTTSHTLRWENTPERYDSSGSSLTPWRYFAALDYRFTKYRNFDVRERWNDLSFSGGISTNVLDGRKWHYGVTVKVHAGPAGAGDFSAEAFARWQINDLMHLRLRAVSARSTPSQRLSEYRSNHFRWSNDFDPAWHNRLSLLFRCDHGDIDAELTWHHVGRFLYLDENLAYQQANSPLHVLVFRASKAFDTKHIYFYTGITAQYVGNRDLLRLPQFILKQSLHYQGGFFSGKVRAHLGFDINYYTNYYADGYNPAIMDFHLQQGEKLKFYPVMDVFFEIFIKRARIFFLLQHANQGMFGQKGYFAAPAYPMQDRAFKAGVSWLFYD